MKVLHIITGLNTAGANMMLYKLVSHMDRRTFATEVVSLTDVGPVGRKIQALDIPVRAVGMRRGRPNPLALIRLAYWLRRDPPDVIQTWTYHADLIGGLSAKLAGGIPVAWGIRHSTFDPQTDKRMTIWTARICARLSGWLPKRIVCCSEASLRVHARLGYASEKLVVIPNGFDLTRFKLDLTARQSVRAELEIPSEAPLVGLVARFHPQKDHRTFIDAAARLHARAPHVHFLLCGDDVTWQNSELVGWIEAAGIRNRVHLLGRRMDIPRLTAALDVASMSASHGEGFPNVIGEAMACGVPCVVTDVGDSAIIVGDTGVVVPPKDGKALADAWYELLFTLEREAHTRLGRAARKRVAERYDVKGVARRYEQVYQSLASGEYQVQYERVASGH